MSADKRDFSDFKLFGGIVNAETNNYEFPTLLKTTENNKIREWTIYIRLIKADSKSTNTKSQNWNLLEENQIQIKPIYFEQDVALPEGTLVQMWTESGVTGMKISRSAATYIIGKNIGKKNERNSFQQALITARGKFLKKQDEGSTIVLSTATTTDTNVKFYPMLAKNYKDFINKVIYPVYVQPKLDGVRCVTYLNTIKNPTISNVIMYSRQQKDYPSSKSNDNIRELLLPILIKYYNNDTQQSVYLDGELYKNNVSLQQINSGTRGDNGDLMEYHIYDMFYPSYTNETFTMRTTLLKQIYMDLPATAKKYIQFVPTHLVETESANNYYYKMYLDKKYEGIMIRTTDGPYLKSSVKKSEALRAKYLLKRKEVFTDEFEVVDYTSGISGKEVDAIVWICTITSGKTFRVVPNITHEERYTIYKQCESKFKSKYQGRMLTCEYRGKSDDDIPLQVKGIAFRDFK